MSDSPASSSSFEIDALPIRTQPMCADHWAQIAMDLGLNEESRNSTPKQIELWWNSRQRRPVIVEGTTTCTQLQSEWKAMGFNLTGTHTVNTSLSSVYREIWLKIAGCLHKRKKRIQKQRVNLLLKEFGEKGPQSVKDWQRAHAILA